MNSLPDNANTSSDAQYHGVSVRHMPSRRGRINITPPQPRAVTPDDDFRRMLEAIEDETGHEEEEDEEV